MATTNPLDGISQSDIQAIVGLTRAQLDLNQALSLSNLEAALGAVASGTANASILFPGNSTTVGAGSGGTLHTGDQKSFSRPSQLAAMLNRAGINTHTNSVRGDGFSSIFTSAMDPRVTVGTSWTQGTGTTQAFVGGACWKANTNTDALSFKPNVPVDTFVIQYWRNSGGGSLSIDVNGGTPTIQSTNGSAGLQTVNITAPLGINQVNIKWSSGSLVFVTGFDAYDSSKKWLNIINAGWYGSKITDWQAMVNNAFVTNPYAQGQCCTVFTFGINDWEQGTSLSTFQTDLDNQVALAIQVGDVIICSDNPTNGTANLATQKTYVDAMQAVATKYGCVFINNWARLVSYAVSFPLNLYLVGDGLHLSAAGYYKLAKADFAIIGSYGPTIQTSRVTTTWARRPDPTTVASGTTFIASDIGSGGTEFISNGAKWRPLNGRCVLAASAVAASHTGDTAETTLVTISIPAGLMSANASLQITFLEGVTNNGNNKTLRVKLGGTTFWGPALTTINAIRYQVDISNQNATNSQVAMQASALDCFTYTGAGNLTGSVDMSISQNLLITAQCANSADTITLNRYLVELVDA